MQYIDEVCNFLCQNMRVTFKIAAAFAFLYITHVSNGNAPFELANAPFQTQTNARKYLRFVLERKSLYNSILFYFCKK